MDLQDAVHDPLDGLFEIRVFKHDCRALTAELERDALEVRLRRGLHDLAADDGAAGERDLADAGVLGDRLARDAAEAGEDVEHARREARLRDELRTLDTDTPTLDELNSLPYLENFVKEVLRFYAPVPWTARAAIRDDVVPLEEPFTDKKGLVCYEIKCVGFGLVPEVGLY